MLARAERLVSAADYRRVVRRGRRASSALMTVYTTPCASDDEWRFGFIVSRAVGNAVVRNRVRRRLKALCSAVRTHFSHRGTGFDVVLRAHPASASASFAELEHDVVALIARSTAPSGGDVR